ncbi:hypothetical protein D3C85_872910 [compost metagenome]
MHALQGEGCGWALLHNVFAIDHLHGEAMLAAIDIHQLQDRHIDWLAVGLAVQQQAQPVGAFQARLDQYVYREGAIVGAQGFGIGQTGQLQYFIGLLGWLISGGFSNRRGFVGRLALNAVEGRQVDRLDADAVRRLIAVRSGAVGVCVFVDLRHGGQGDQRQDEQKTTTHGIDRKRKRWVVA